jgi:hypothetical protein
MASRETDEVTQLDDLTVTGVPPITNPLLHYPSYTYGLSLHLLSSDQYNTIVKEQKYTPTNVLIASAGRRQNPGEATFKRDPHFTDDFYFENLEMTTVIALNKTSRATNAISLSFKISEPYGLSLFDRLIAANKRIGSENYLASPYLVQIDFFGIDDEGVISKSISKTQRRIPIKIIKMDIKATSSGSEYEFEAIPFNHSAYDVSSASTPANFEIAAGTVNGFFGDKKTSEIEKSVKERATDNQGRANQFFTTKAAGGTQDAQTFRYSVHSYAAAWNSWFDELKTDDKLKVADSYAFKFYGGIGDSKFREIHSQSNVNVFKPIPKHDEKSKISRTLKQGLTTIYIGDDTNERIFTIGQGTSIDSIINYVVRNSMFIQEQIKTPIDLGKDSVKYKQKDVPLTWFKIIPTIELKDYDKTRKDFGRIITYHVLPYTIYDAKSPLAPQAPVPENNIAKTYNYYYTGKNIDIIDFNIEFNALYYTAITAYGDRVSTTQKSTSDKEVKKNVPEAGQEDSLQSNEAGVTNITNKHVVNNAEGGLGLETDATGVAVKDTQNSLYTSAGADMLALDLKIFGDPAFIKQDDVFYPPQTIATATVDTGDSEEAGIVAKFTANGSIITDNGEVYVRVNMESKTDIDEETGLMKYYGDDDASRRTSSRRTSSVFSGLYRVLTVKSAFEGGQFTQVLSLVRLDRQPTKADKKPTKEARVKTEKSASPVSDINILKQQNEDSLLNAEVHELEAAEAHASPAPHRFIDDANTAPKIDPGLNNVLKKGKTESFDTNSIQKQAPSDFKKDTTSIPDTFFDADGNIQSR